MTYEHFTSAGPSPRATWRLAVLMGSNSRTYKSALAHALLTCATRGESDEPIPKLAAPSPTPV